jgi:hypothetical protein
MQPTVGKVIHNVLGICKGKYCNIIKKGAQQSIALTIVRICVIHQSQKFDSNATHNCQKCLTPEWQSLSTHTHTAVWNVETLSQLQSEVLEHAPYSPDIAPSDYLLFSSLKDALGSHQFTSNQEVKALVRAGHSAK